MTGKLLFKIIILLVAFSGKTAFLFAQVSPYSLSPKWHFGNRSGLDFTSGTAAFLPGGQTNSLMTIEGSSSICDPSKNLVFYSDGYSVYDGNNVFIQNANGGTSSTQNSVIVPDPSDPANKFYLFTANVDDNGGGDKPATANLGIHYYRVQKVAGSVSVLSGPVKLANHDAVSEQICAGTDGNGNYWVVAHEGGNYGWMNWNFRAWPVTSAGVGAPVISTLAGAYGNNPWQGALKINRCQTKIANVLSSSGVLEVYNWDAANGKVVSLITRLTGLSTLYGCEFSPNGNILYYTSISGNMLYQLDLTTGIVYNNPAWTSSNNTNELGTLQLGPDNKIYVTNVSTWGTPSYIGVINDPDVPGVGCNYIKTGFLINAGPAVYPNINRGIANIAWLNPSLPVINNSSGCMAITFSYEFKNYFNETITVKTNSEEWDFGDGTGFHAGLGANPTYTYPAEGPYNVTLRFKDATCDKLWTRTKTISVDCALPVTFLFTGAEQENDKIKITWATAAEINSTSFVILRSTDGINYEEIGAVKAIGNASQITSYNFIDGSAFSGNLYYQVKEVDTNGEVSSSAIVTVASNKTDCLIFPNPSQHEFKLLLTGSEQATVIVYDILGREVGQEIMTNDYRFGSDLSKGKYIVKVILSDQVIVKEIIKE